MFKFLLFFLIPSLGISNNLCDKDNPMVNISGNPYINDIKWDSFTLSVFLEDELKCKIGFEDLEKRKFLTDSFDTIKVESLNKSNKHDISVEISQKEAKIKMWEVFYKTLNDK